MAPPSTAYRPVLGDKSELLYKLRAPLTVFMVFMILIAWVTAFSLMAIAFVVTYPILSAPNRRTLLGRIFRGVNGIFVIVLNPLWNMKVIGNKPEVKGGTIVMSNHLSNADAFMTCWALFPTETKYVAKGNLFSLPFGGWAMSLAGDMPVHFTAAKDGWGTKKGSVGELMRTAKARLTDKENIAVFPEGVRSFDGRLNDFKDGMFSLALETGAPIQPMVLSGPQMMWPRGDWRMCPGTCYVRFGTVVPTEGHTVASLKAAVRAQMEALLEDMPPTSELKPADGRNKQD